MSQLAVAVALGLQVFAPPQPVKVLFGSEVAGRNVTICLDGRNPHATFAGKLGFRDRNSTWSSVCGGVRQPVRMGQYFWVLPGHTSKLGGNIAKAGNIVAKYFGAAKTNDECAALQLAVWEALEDGGAMPDFANGHFAVMASPSVLNLAEEAYQAIGEPGDSLWLQTGGGSGDGQNQITQTRV